MYNPTVYFLFLTLYMLYHDMHLYSDLCATFLRVPVCNIYFRPICLAIWAESPVLLSVVGAMDHSITCICLFHVY